MTKTYTAWGPSRTGNNSKHFSPRWIVATSEADMTNQRAFPAIEREPDVRFCFELDVARDGGHVQFVPIATSRCYSLASPARATTRTGERSPYAKNLPLLAGKLIGRKRG